jgi:hypothetical protein
MTAFAALQASLSAVTPPSSPGETGTVIDLGVAQDAILLYATVSGSGEVHVSFSGSLDNSVWYSIDGGQFGNLNAGQTVATVPGYPARYVEAISFTESGSPVVTASVAGAVC